MRKLITVTIIFILSFKMNGQELDNLYANAINNESFMSYFIVDENEIVTDNQLKKWIDKNPHLFENIDSISTVQNKKWFWGSTKTLISTVSFVKSENIEKRRLYFAEIARKKEEARLAELRQQEELRRQEQQRKRIENERLARIKSEIEDETFTGNHFYQYSYGKYSGNFVNGKPDGYGEQYFGNGNWYKGNFKEGYRHGDGTERIKESGDWIGLQISGNYYNGKKNGVFKAFKGTMLTGNNEWELVFENGNLISNSQTSSKMSDFWNDSSGDYSSSNNSSSSSNENKKGTTELDCETTFNNISITKKGSWENDNSLAFNDYRQKIEFSDGINGYIYQGSETKKYFLSLNPSSIYYDGYESVIRALYIYKKCDKITKAGKN